MGKKYIVIAVFLSFSILSAAQIPVLSIKKNIFKMDSIFEKEAISKSYYRAFNRWFKQADMNNDGKPDLILQSYQHKNRAGIVSVLYNKTTAANNIIFENNTAGNLYTEGDPGQFDVGDVDGDADEDLLIMTENYHGKPEDKPLEWYRTQSNDHTVDKLFLNNGTAGFSRLIFPDTFNTASGRLIDINKDLKKEILISNYTKPMEADPQHQDKNLIYKYNLINNQLVRNSTLYSNNNNLFSRVGHATEIGDKIYFQIENRGNDFNDSVLIISFNKGDSLSLISKHDTIAIIAPRKQTKDEYVYTYFPTNEFGIHIVDLDKDGSIEVVTQEFMYIKYADGRSVANDIGSFNLGVNGLSHTRIQVYNKSGNISNQWLDSTLQYDPTRIAHGNGIKLEDINNDGLLDILPIAGWGWWPFTMGDPLIADDIKKKRILLNSGKKFTSFTLKFNTEAELNILQVQSFIYPISFEKNKPSSILYIKEGGETSNPSFNETNGVINLDFSQFQFPCTNFPPTLNITGNKIFCTNSDSAIMKTVSIVGYKTVWYKNGLIKANSNQFIIKDTGSYKVNVTNLGGCQIEKTFTVIKNPIPTAPTLSRDTDNNLVSGATGTTWYKDGSAITDTTQKYKPTTAGSYTAKTTKDGCTSEMSAAYYFLVTDIINISKDEFIKLAPNPFINQLNFDFIVKGYQKLNMEVYDIATGTKVASQPNLTAGSRITLGQLSAGTYIIRITSNDNKISYQFKMVKL